MKDVRRLRARHDPARLRFPIEITVAGSSGLGWFSDGQAQAELLGCVRGIARGFPSFLFRFEKVDRFPGSNVYYLAPDDGSRFHEFQNRLANCGLRFERTQYAYVPHCTIAILAQDAPDAAHAEVKACTVPAGDLRVSSVSFWSVDPAGQEARQGARVALGA